ncbi:MAG: hypothetical protein ABI432_04400 [Flavobacteriales bacterium]
MRSDAIRKVHLTLRLNLPRSHTLIQSVVVLCAISMLWFNAMTVHRLNLDIGGWVLFIGIVNAALLFASIDQFDQSRLKTHLALLAATVAVFLYVDRTSAWKATCEVRTATEVFVFEDPTRYFAPTSSPNHLPFAAVNDVWAIRDTTDVDCIIRWVGPSDPITVHTELGALFSSRGDIRSSDPASSQAWIIISVLLLIGLAAFMELVSNFSRDVRWPFSFLRTAKAAVLFFLLGVLVASVQFPPGDWLSNEFLSRPDDWLCYEKGARQILGGNPLLLPAPGGVEMWSPLYTYLVAAFHFLFGPALGASHVITYGMHWVVIWAMLALLSPGHRGLAWATAIGTLLFIEVDLNRHYAWRLLSDTLPVLLLPLLLIAWKRGSDLRVLGLLCGLLYLARLELLGIGPLLLATFYVTERKRLTRNGVIGFLLAFAVCVVPYLLRRYALFCDLLPWPLGMGESGHTHWRTLLSWDFLVLKASAIFGHYDALNPDLRFRYHWMVVHALFLSALIIAVGKRAADRYILFALLAWVYVFFTRMASPSIGIYGHRHSLLLILLEMVTVILVAERFFVIQGPQQASATRPSSA